MIGYKIKIYVEIKNVISCYERVICKNEKLLSLLEEEELIWLFSSVILLLIFLRKPDEQADDHLL